MSANTNVANQDRNWSSKKLIELSDNLGQAYNPGLNNESSDRKTDSWNADKFIQMSRCLSSAYGVDF
ncbi:hypothetical protein I4641_19450 [Waterburya agarophytonicola K14]|uniref:Uncharacterized protein n=1 Tax=Waterburya agarophytonicola KI4 TaxID=2874699 RepID=A0A964BTD9_9CYAN|nr:hypothetical protein [Waterburya agarophytonicola]MCC0179145.1 hypothetical protein [Waterburya agarophytonicola KI4]